MRCWESIQTSEHSIAAPPVMTAKSSDCVSFFRYGLMSSEASVCPRKMFAAVFIDSTRVVPKSLANAPPMILTTHCSTPMWKSTAVSVATKMMTGSTFNAKMKPESSRSPKTKVMPAFAESMTFWMPALTVSRACRPSGQ